MSSRRDAVQRRVAARSGSYRTRPAAADSPGEPDHAIALLTTVRTHGVRKRWLKTTAKWPRPDASCMSASMFWRATSTISAAGSTALFRYNSAAASFEARVLPARKLRDLNVTTAAELPAAEPIATVPRTLKQAGLLELEEAASDPEITQDRRRE